jgi:hypothetical protein
VREEEDCIGFFKARTDDGIQALLSQLVRWSSQRSRHADMQFEARAGRTYTLRKPTIWFRRLCEKTEVREWLQEQVENGNDVYFVVGLCTLFDAAVTLGTQLISEHSGHISVPAAEISGFPPDAADIGLSASHRKDYGSGHRCVASGEQIFAIRLKKVVFRFWAPGDLSSMRLGRNSHWRMASDNRDTEGDSEIVEASLEGDSTEEKDELAKEDDLSQTWMNEFDVIISNKTGL